MLLFAACQTAAISGNGDPSADQTPAGQSGEDVNNPNNDPTLGGGDGGDGDGGGPGNDPGPSLNDCVTDRVPPPSGDGCTCSYPGDCDATTIECTCDLECYGQADCLINSNSDGDALSDPGSLGCGGLSCNPEDDKTESLSCTATECEVLVDIIVIDPVNPPVAPPVVAVAVDREVQDVGVMFVIDNSGSMADDQMAAACAMDSFFNTAGANDASYETGVLTTDVLGDRDGADCPHPGGTYENNGDFKAPPELVGLEPGCTAAPECVCGTNQNPSVDVCDMNGQGDWLPSDDPNNQDILKQLIVQGDGCSHKEAGLENAFQYFAEQERQGTFDPNKPYEIVVISDEDASGELQGSHWMCPFDSIDRNTAGIPNWDPPTPSNSNTTQGCKNDLAAFYTWYFNSRNITVHGLNFTNDCVSQSSEAVGQVYLSVVNATGGQAGSICHCEDFGDFFTDVGDDVSARSTSICLEPDQRPTPDTIVVTYTEAGASEQVPASGTDGWTYDENLNCVVFNGSWQDRYGSYNIDYIDVTTPPQESLPPIDCLDPGVVPVKDSIVVKCDDAVVPESSTEGWTIGEDPAQQDTYCFTFHGTYADASCEFTVEYVQ